MTVEERRHQDMLERLRRLRPIDDDFMRCMFQDNIPLAQLVLRIITGKPDLVITKCETQRDMKRLAGARSLCLDAYGTDSQGKRYDLEIQRADSGADPFRARYHSSVMDIENLDQGQDFSDLPETYAIFITEKDFYQQGKPLYPIERMNLETGTPFGDGEHILYVNGEYRGDSDLGKLMHDFGCTDAGEMQLPLMAERAGYLKENPKGVGTMCKVIQELAERERAEGWAEGREKGRDEGRDEGRREILKPFLEDGKLGLEEISKILRLPLDEVKRLSKG